jgi:hypothetical protein
MRSDLYAVPTESYTKAAVQVCFLETDFTIAQLLEKDLPWHHQQYSISVAAEIVAVLVEIGALRNRAVYLNMWFKNLVSH